MLNGLPLHRLPQPITEDTIVRDACDYGFRTRRRSDLLNASQVSLDHVVICATGSRSTLVEFFRVIVPSLRGTFTLVTLESDESAPPLASMLEEPKLISWFGWNMGMSHPKLRALPIGLNEGRHRAAVEAARSRTRAPGNGRVLINFHISPMRPERIDLWEQSEFWPFADRRLYNRSMVFQRPGVEGTTTRDAFYALLTRYSFVASPRGLGTDTHRTWEALYLGVIPIVRRSPISELYSGLPVIELKEWGDLDRATLRASLAASRPESFVSAALDVRTWIAKIRARHVQGTPVSRSGFSHRKAGGGTSPCFRCSVHPVVCPKLLLRSD